MLRLMLPRLLFMLRISLVQVDDHRRECRLLGEQVSEPCPAMPPPATPKKLTDQRGTQGLDPARPAGALLTFDRAFPLSGFSADYFHRTARFLTHCRTFFQEHQVSGVL